MKSFIEKIKNNKVKFIFYFTAILFLIFFFVSIMLSHGNLMKNYLFANPGNTFMDFFNSMYDVIGLRPYEKGVIYPPLCYLIYYALTLFSTPDQLAVENGEMLKTFQGPMVSFMLYSIIIVLSFVFLTLQMKKGSNKEKYLFITLMMFSIPFLFAFERGNIILVSFILLLVFMCFKDSENKVLREIALVSLAASAAIKIYPAIFGLILVKEKRWLDIFRVITYGLILFVLPFLFFGGLETFKLFFYNILHTSNEFSTTVVANKMNFVAYIDFLVRGFHLGDTNLGFIGRICVIILVVASIINLLRTDNNFIRILLLTLLMIGIPGISFTYAVTFLSIPLIYFLDSKEKRKIDYLYLVLFILIMFPCPFAILERGDIAHFYYTFSTSSTIMATAIVAMTLLANIDVFVSKGKKKLQK